MWPDVDSCMRLGFVAGCWIFFGCLTAVEVEVESTTMVVAGDLDPERAIRIQLNPGMRFRLAGTTRDFSWWCLVNLDREPGEAIARQCLDRLRQAKPENPVLVSRVTPAVTVTTPDPRDRLVRIGKRVPGKVVMAALAAARSVATGTVYVVFGNDDDGIISIGPRPAAQGVVLDPATWQELVTLSRQNHELRNRLDDFSVPPEQSSPSPTLPMQTLLDLDLRSADGKPPAAATAGTWSGVTWSPAGLVLRGAKLIPAGIQPLKPPYVAEIPIPGLSRGERSLTVTMVVWQATWAVGIDEVFTIGRRSRWLSAHIEADGSIRTGLDNCFILLPRLGDPPADTPAVKPGAWHTVSISRADTERWAFVAVDGVSSREFLVPAGAENPRRVDSPAEDVLSFVDFANARHLHGVVQRLIVQRGALRATQLARWQAGIRADGTIAPTDLAPLATPPKPKPPEEPQEPANF